MNNTEAKVISAVLKDKQAHVLMQANVDNLLRTHNDLWQFIRNYSEVNGTVPPIALVVDKFRDFTPIEDVGATKYHLEELQTEAWADMIPNQPISPLIHQVILRDGAINKGKPLLDTIPEKYRRL